MEVKMNKRITALSLLAIVVALALVLVSVQLVAAQETENEVEITGMVLSINAPASFVVQTENGPYTVIPGEGFDFNSIQVGDTVEVEGSLNEDGSIAATKIEVESPEEEDDPAEEQDDPSEGYFCTQSEVMHPFAERLLAHYDTDYATLQAWFCDGFGWGQIMLALQTSEVTDDLPEDLLDRRRGGEGWGQIWQDLKLIGRPEHAGPPNDENGDGRPDFAGPPGEADRGRPDFAGPPGQAGGGRPDFAGPPGQAGGGRP
jgi:hypothetical protein